MSTPHEEWEEKAQSCIKDNKLLEGLGILPDILELGVEMDLDPYAAALLYHGKNIKKDSPEK